MSVPEQNVVQARIVTKRIFHPGFRMLEQTVDEVLAECQPRRPSFLRSCGSKERDTVAMDL